MSGIQLINIGPINKYNESWNRAGSLVCIGILYALVDKVQSCDPEVLSSRLEVPSK